MPTQVRVTGQCHNISLTRESDKELRINEKCAMLTKIEIIYTIGILALMDNIS